MAPLFLHVGNTGSDGWLAVDVAAAFRPGFVLQNTIAWAKPLAIGEDTAGHFKPNTRRRYLNDNHETVCHFTKAGTVPIDRLAVGIP